MISPISTMFDKSDESHSYGSAQFKVDKACVWHVLDTTHFSFRMRAGMRALARSMT